MNETILELAARLRKEAEQLEVMFLDEEQGPSYQARLEEEGRLEELLNLAQDRLSELRLEALQDALEDVEGTLRNLREDSDRRKEEGRPDTLVRRFIDIAEIERNRIHRIIDAASRAEEISRPARKARQSRQLAPPARAPRGRGRTRYREEEALPSAEEYESVGDDIVDSLDEELADIDEDIDAAG
ncbi:MAG: hypothetical protein AB1758_16885 [Candidatus Eremiobacterota bacterium]